MFMAQAFVLKLLALSRLLPKHPPAGNSAVVHLKVLIARALVLLSLDRSRVDFCEGLRRVSRVSLTLKRQTRCWAFKRSQDDEWSRIWSNKSLSFYVPSALLFVRV
jgi:hypothetical protein